MIKMMVSVFEMVMFHSYIKLAKGTLMFAIFIHTLQAFFRLACPSQSFSPERVCGFVFAASQVFFAIIFLAHTHTYIIIYIYICKHILIFDVLFSNYGQVNQTYHDATSVNNSCPCKQVLKVRRLHGQWNLCPSLGVARSCEFPGRTCAWPTGVNGLNMFEAHATFGFE